MSRPLEESTYAFTVPLLVEAVPAARERVVHRAGRLGLALDKELANDLKLLTGELIANSVTHTRAACVVSIRWTGERLRVEEPPPEGTASGTADRAVRRDAPGRTAGRR